MTKEQVLKILRAMGWATILMFIFEVIFEIPGVCSTVGNWITNVEASGAMWAVYAVIWLIMFVQVCFIPIPAYIVLDAAIAAGILNSEHGVIELFKMSSTWIFILVTITAYMAGAMVAYYMGRRWGKRVALWCAGTEDEYNKWANALNAKGKKWYFLTVLFPIFPDDLLCLVAGSVRFDCRFFFWSNIIGRTTGLMCMVAALALMHTANSGGFPWSIVGWGVAVVIMIAARVILGIQLRRDKEKEKGESK